MEESEETKELLDVTPSTEKIRRRLRFQPHSQGRMKGSSQGEYDEMTFPLWASPLRMLSMGLENNTRKRLRTFLAVFALIVGSLTIGILGMYHYRKIWKTNDLFKFAGPNDLYAMHDIILTGYAAPFMKDGSQGREDVREAVTGLTRDLLPILHPVKRCRDEIERVVFNREAIGSDLALIRRSADVLWSCLPAKFDSNDFQHPFVFESLKSPRTVLDSRNPILLRRSAVQV